MALNRSATESVDELQLKHLNQSQTELIASSTIEQLSASLQQLNNSPVANLLLSSSASNLFTLNNNGHVLNKWPPFDSSQTDDEFKCPKCKEVMFNVHQADECGCRFCFECLNRIIVQEKRTECTKCGTRFASQFLIPDKYFQKKINKLLVTCSSCIWSGELNDYKDHYQQSHTDEQLTCVFCHINLASSHDLKAHLKSNVCPKQPVECVYKPIGCCEPKDLPLLRENLSLHMNENVHVHLELMYAYVNRKLNELNPYLVNSIHQSPLNSSNDQIMLNSSTIGTASSASNGNNVTFTKINLIEEAIHQFLTKSDNLEKSNRIFTDDLVKMYKQLDRLKEENKLLRESLKEYKTACQDLHKTLAMTQVSLVSLEERIINQEKASTDGVLLWKISNVHERILEAKAGRQTSFYSSPFYTDKYGYKMCARIYLNGDGNGRNTHLSLFFVILRGEFDALLRWPFRQKVSFILIDQSSSEFKENIYDAFRPDPNSSSFRRPTSEMNIASGLPVFCPLSKFLSPEHEYIKDNTMFIKVVVDTKDLHDP